MEAYDLLLNKLGSKEAVEAALDEIRKMPLEKRLEAKAWALAQKRILNARSNYTVEGYLDFYWCLWGREAPPYVKAWVEQFMTGKWTILYCFRGSTKSTSLTITFTAFSLGHFPSSSALIVQAGDKPASKSSATIADIVEFYGGWKDVFPNVVPDKDKGWGAQGYYIKDTDFVEKNGYEKWLERCQKDHLRDPSFVGLGVNSGEIPGMHPRWLLFDDIHDRNNSAYPKDREGVVDTVRANILPTITKAATEEAKPFMGVACTFWDKQDAYHVLLNTGMFEFVRTPVIEFSDDGKFEFEGRKAELTWADGFPMEMVRQYRQTLSSMEFARMYLCDLNVEGLTSYKWLSFEGEVKWDWPMLAGADPVDAFKAVSGREGGRSWFAMGYGLRSPTGAMVVAGGVLEQCTPTDVETYLVRTQLTYPTLQQITMETIGGGGVTFAFMLQRNPSLRVVPFNQTWVYEDYRANKESRQYKILEPLFRNGILQVSTDRTPYLDAVRSYLEHYPNFEKHAKEWDVADSLVMLVAGAPDLNTKWQSAEGVNLYQKKQKRKSAWSGAIGGVHA
jgi:hypothetical protein